MWKYTLCESIAAQATLSTNMYDETSYYAFVPSALVQTQDEKPRAAKQQRKTSLLAQPDVSTSSHLCLIVL
jgi:hypothetical protein